MKNNLLLLFVCFFSISVFSQTEKIAVQQINELKNGVLLVRLQSKKSNIKKMRQLKWHSTAAETERAERADHFSTMKAFKEEFTFCEVYFFTSDQSDKVRLGNYNKMVFLNDSLEEIKVDIPEYKPVYTTEIGDVYFESFGTFIKGMAIMDRTFEVLKKPFPSVIVKQDALLGLSKSKNEMVEIMNEKLLQYHEVQRNLSAK